MVKVLRLQRFEGPWWKSWLAVFGIRNPLDKMAALYAIERERRLLFFWEGNDSLRHRVGQAARGMIATARKDWR